MAGPAKISGVYPIMDIIPTAVPVNTRGIRPFSITEKYKALEAYTPEATIKMDRKNKAVSDSVM